MKVIFGLGNPGIKYQKTRHNVGFMVLDIFQQQRCLERFENFQDILVSENHVNGQKVLMVKPQSFMNLSGMDVKKILNFYKIEVSDILVVYDEANIDIGNYKISVSRSMGGHNGVKNIIQEVGGNQFAKLRVGIANLDKTEQIIGDFVLSDFSQPDWQRLQLVMPRLFDILDEFIGGKSAADMMNKFNY